MRWILRVLVAMAVMSGLVSCVSGTRAAKKELDIVAFGAYVDRDPSKKDVTPDIPVGLLKIVGPRARAIMVFNCRPDTVHILPLAHKMDVGVIAGTCLGIGPKDDEFEMECLEKECRAGNVNVAFIGDECLQNGMAEDNLIEAIRRIKATGVKTTVSDNWKEFIEHPKVAAECSKMLIATCYPYWEGVHIDNALSFIKTSYDALKKACPDKEIWICSGWPFAGKTIGQAISSLENASRYNNELSSWGKKEGVRIIHFEAFDEPWKASREGTCGAHWGIWDSSGNLKPGMLHTD